MIFGPIGTPIAGVVAAGLTLWGISGAKKLTDIHWPTVILMAGVCGGCVGLWSALLTGTLPNNGGGSSCSSYAHLGRGLEWRRLAGERLEIRHLPSSANRASVPERLATESAGR